MNCEQIANELPLYLYGELSQEQEERVEHHLAACEPCQSELGKARALHGAFDLAAVPSPDDLLGQCRMDLTRALRKEPAESLRTSLLDRLRDFMHAGIGFRIPAGALALIAVGFLAGKAVPWTLPFLNTSGEQAGIASQGFVNVRTVERSPDGRVQIAFDNVNPRTLSGTLADARVRELLVAAMRNDSNPGLRVQTTDVLKNNAGESDIQGALLESVLHDPNVGVRLNALEGLKAYAGEPGVRKALTEALLNDANPGVRVKVIDVLTATKDDALVGPLQNLMRKEDNSYVRMRVSNVLHEMNASVETF